VNNSILVIGTLVREWVDKGHIAAHYRVRGVYLVIR
jgi:hypothetical protein